MLRALAVRSHHRTALGETAAFFRELITHDLTVVTRLMLGKLTLRIPPDVGVKLELQRIAAGFEHTGLVKRDDGWYSPNYETAQYKLNVKAETFFGQVEVQRASR